MDGAHAATVHAPGNCPVAEFTLLVIPRVVITL
jgi:hypothetical protein